MDTVVGGVDLDACDASTKLSGEMAVWRFTGGKKNRWDVIDDDCFLFFTGDKYYEYAARVINKEENLELATELWPNYRSGETGGDDPGEPWEYIVHWDVPTRIEVDSREIIHEYDQLLTSTELKVNGGHNLAKISSRTTMRNSRSYSRFRNRKISSGCLVYVTYGGIYPFR